MSRLAAFALLFALLVPEDAAAQRPGQRAPRVDPLTASISGKVTTSDTGVPIRGAEVRLSLDGRANRLATTNGDGRFEVRDLAAGDYRVTVSRAGFVSLQYGQRRPFETARTITLAEGASAEANVALIRGGVIYGRVLDQYGEPLASTRVQVLRSRSVQGRRRLQSVGAPDQTDDTGAFRIYGLPPGDYYVAAAAGFGDQVKRDPPTYYPGTPNFVEAQPIALAQGVEASADFQIAPIRNARVSGVVMDSSGNPVPALVNLVSDTVSTGPALESAGTVAALQIHADAEPNGTFTLENVPPGPYSLTAMLMPNIGPNELIRNAQPARPTITDMLRMVPEQNAMPLVVSGDDISGVALVLRKPAILRGSFIADTGVSRPLPNNLQVSQRSSTSGGASMRMGNSSEREFQLVGLAGPFTLAVEVVPEGWTVKAMMIDGRDVIDDTIDLRGQNATLRIVMSDRPSSVVGSAQLRGEPADLNIVVFPEDATKWTYPSRYIRVTRADTRGRFRIPDLPSGERYLAAALDYVEDGEQDDPQFLERLRLRATSFSLSEGEQRSLQLDAITR